MLWGLSGVFFYLTLITSFGAGEGEVKTQAQVLILRNLCDMLPATWGCSHNSSVTDLGLPNSPSLQPQAIVL